MTGAKWQLLNYSILMGTIILSAYLGWIPTQLHEIPFYDRAGHFVLYGLWGYFFGNAFQTPLFSNGKFDLQAGIIFMMALAVIEESLQQFSPMRTFSLADLAFGLSGILLACVFLNLKTKHS